MWPSALGCRRGDLSEFAIGVLPRRYFEMENGCTGYTLIPPSVPDHTEAAFKDFDFNYTKPPTWRTAPRLNPSKMVLPDSFATGDKYQQAMYKIQRTQIHGVGLMELLAMLADHQRSIPKEVLTKPIPVPFTLPTDPALLRAPSYPPSSTLYPSQSTSTPISSPFPHPPPEVPTPPPAPLSYLSYPSSVAPTPAPSRSSSKPA